jgi:hypothetical protein
MKRFSDVRHNHPIPQFVEATIALARLMH